MDRRLFNAGAALVLTGCGTAVTDRKNLGFKADWARLEASVGGRLGVAVLDTGSGRCLGHRLDERFPLCSTFKWLAAALVLQRVDAGVERLDRPVPIKAGDLLEHSPVTAAHVGRTLTLAALCEATITLSDNAAANLILGTFGGPAALTAYTRSLGDPTTRLDRDEPTLNEARPGDERDTTTPTAMVATLRKVLLGDALSASSRERLTDWMLATKTSDDRLRAHLPEGWRLGDKTGAGGNGTLNDVGVVWATGREPVVVAVYLTEAANATPAARNAVIADAGRIIWAGM